MLASQQVMKPHVSARSFQGRKWNDDGVKTLIKKTDMTNSIHRQRERSCTVRVCLQKSTTLKDSHSANSCVPVMYLHTQLLCDCDLASWLSAIIVHWIDTSLGSVNTITKNGLQLTCLKKSKAKSLTGTNKLSTFNCKSCYLQMRKFDVIIM